MPKLTADQMRKTVQKYYDGCNEGDVAKIKECWTPEGVHYFPPGMYEGPFRGAQKIGEKWKHMVDNFGSYWTIDCMAVDESKSELVLEWTHFKTNQGKVLRGSEWVVFDPASERIKEIRAYYASPQDPNLSRLELGGFDYEGRGYQMESPRPK